jgi:hypothetical protein
MNRRDPHSALTKNVVAQANWEAMEMVIGRLQWSKDELGHSLHVNPTSYSSAGLQKTDFLAYLGFQRSDKCSFTSFRRCYWKWVDDNFNVEEFAAAFASGFARLEQAEHRLEACGFLLPQPEGWGFYNGRPSGRSRGGPPTLSGDGHTADQRRPMKATEDDTFLFRFTFIETGGDEGFVTHYRPKHPPLSSELRAVFDYLGLREFRECPEFEFEPCYYRTLAFQSRDEGVFDNNTEYAHRAFDAHAGQFSAGIENLLASNAEVEKVGMAFLPVSTSAERINLDIATRIIRAKPGSVPGAARPARMRTLDAAMPSNFDVAISFAGTERDHAEALAKIVQSAGFAVFYDNFYPEHLWGKNLTAFLDEVYRKKARFCVILISNEYKNRIWTNHEFRSAQARAVELKGEEYILPIKVDDVDLEGLPPNVAYLPIAVGIEQIADLLIKKLRS